ncbi:zinc finger protein 714-like [Pelobates fuscus]|uniref:zinc finger protein 714-like n=1 Tax=Pelobates fuscus TaxID=191477 RepID=UPI002FE44094
MDSDIWKMAPPSFTFVKNRDDNIVHKTLHVSHSNYLNKEKIQKRPNQLKLNEDSGATLSLRGQDRTKGKPHYKESSVSFISKCTEKKWITWKSESMEHIQTVTLNPGQDVEIAPMPGFVKESKDGSRTCFSRIDEKNMPRHNFKLRHYNPTEIKVSTSVPFKRNKAHVNKYPLPNETIFNNTNPCEESNRYLGIPLYNPSKNNMIQKNISYQGGTIETQEKINPVHTMDTVDQKVYDKPFCSTDLPTGSHPYKETSIDITQKTGFNKCIKVQREKIFSSTLSQDIITVETKVNKQKDSPEENSTYRRFLLIDNQGMPYTMVVEEPELKQTSKLSSETSADVKHSVNSRSLAPRKVYTCPVCFRIFEYLSYLQRHSIAHSQQKPHMCTICGKAFKRTSHLTRHKYIHFGGKLFQCQVCQHRFRDTGELTRHQKIHTFENHHQSDVCHRHFGEQTMLQHHIDSKHTK